VDLGLLSAPVAPPVPVLTPVNQDYTEFVNRVLRLFDASPEILNELRRNLTSVLNGKKVEKYEIVGGSSEAPVTEAEKGESTAARAALEKSTAASASLTSELASLRAQLESAQKELAAVSSRAEAESNPPPAMVGGGSNCDSDMAMAGKPLTPEHLTAPTTTPVAGFPDSHNVKPRSTKPWVYRLASQSDCAKIVSEIDAGMRTSKTPSVSWRKGPYHPNNPSVKSVIAVLASGGDMSKKQIKAMSNLNPKRVSEILRELKKQEIVLLE